MADDQTAHRSRRALLAAAAGGAAAIAAQAALPLTTLAADGQPVLAGSANEATATTTLANSTTGSDAFSVTSTGLGVGVVGSSSLSAGVRGVSVDGGAGAETNSGTTYTGVYGWAPAGDGATTVGSGVWGDSPDIGVYGTGYFGVYGAGAVGVIGQADDATSLGVHALGATASSPALKVTGKVSFNRSGRKAIGAGKTSVVVSLAGVTTSSKIFAVLSNNRSGRYVRAVVPGTNQFTIYLNTSYTSLSYIAWFVID